MFKLYWDNPSPREGTGFGALFIGDKMNFQELVRRPAFVVVAVVVVLLLGVLLAGCPQPAESTQTTAQVVTEVSQPSVDNRDAEASTRAAVTAQAQQTHDGVQRASAEQTSDCNCTDCECAEATQRADVTTPVVTEQSGSTRR